jgi:adenylate cyclase class 2
METSEIKILNIDIETVCSKLIALGAKNVFDNARIITYFKNNRDVGQPFLKLTEEDKLKLTSQNGQTHKEIKLFVSRKEECVALLETLGYYPVSEVSARRISYELDGVDCDIDVFPEIPAFLEVDVDDTGIVLNDFLAKLGISENTRGVMSTPEIVQSYGKDYFEVYKK